MKNNRQSMILDIIAKEHFSPAIHRGYRMIRPMGSVIKSLSKERHKTVYPLCRNGFKVSKTHSHSMVAGGLEVIS